MNNAKNMVRSVSAVACLLMLAATPVLAGKPDDVGGGKGGKKDKGPDKEMRSDDRGGDKDRDRDRSHDRDRDREHSSGGVGISLHFTDEQRTRVREYYGQQVHAGHCPPGLAKKNNGCMPPGQAKKWAVGQPLPRDVIFHDLEPEIVIRLGIPPPDHRFVRVAGDILLIAAGTGMVLDAIEDLSNL